MDDEPFNLLAMKHNIRMALKNMGKDPDILDNFLDTAQDGTEALEKFKAAHES